jgi:hypothetical protein
MSQVRGLTIIAKIVNQISCDANQYRGSFVNVDILLTCVHYIYRISTCAFFRHAGPALPPVSSEEGRPSTEDQAQIPLISSLKNQLVHGSSSA